MRYWVYLVAKLAVAGGFLYGLARAVAYALPAPKPYVEGGPWPAAHDFSYTFAMLLFTLFGAGMLRVIIWDQRRRCRTCLRTLRMPIHRGSWTHVLLGAPRTEYICLYGHGTLKVADLQITGPHPPDWEPHEDMWKELFSLEETRGR
jgi:hypothetical protein